MSPTKEEMVSKAQRDIRRKRQVLDYAAQHGNVRKTCRQFLREGEKWVICKIGLPGIELDNPEIMASQVSGQDVEERGFS